jgi:hypothetical protein
MVGSRKALKKALTDLKRLEATTKVINRKFLGIKGDIRGIGTRRRCQTIIQVKHDIEKELGRMLG